MSLDLLIVGLDGLDPRLLEYMRSKGYMPTFDELVADGATLGAMASRVGSQSVPHTGPAWTTIYTGLTEREHGVTQGGWLLGDVSLEPHFEQTLFHSLSRSGYDVGSFTMPITYPATVENSKSWMVSGFPAMNTTDKIVAPHSLKEHLPPSFNEYQARELLQADESRHASASKWVEAERYKSESILPEILEKHPVDVLCYGTQITDAMCHRARIYPRYFDSGIKLLTEKINDATGWSLQPPRTTSIAWREDVRTAYQQADRIVEQLLTLTDPDRLLVVSDHGFKLDGRGHALLGTSLTLGDIQRPEHIAEVKYMTEEALGVQSSETAEIDRQESTLSDLEREQVQEQLESLGYLDNT